MTDAFYGLVLDPELSGPQVQAWRPTHDVADIGRPAAEFIPCESVAAGRAELEARHPVRQPPDGAKTYPVVRVSPPVSVNHYDHAARGHRLTQGVVLVADHPVLEKLPGRYSLSVPQLMATAAAQDGLYLDIPNFTTREGWNASASMARDKLYNDERYRGSDLIMRQVKLVGASVTQSVNAPEAYLVVTDPKKAKARRTAKTRRERQHEKAAKLQAEKTAKAASLNDAYLHLREAGEKLWAAVPEVAAGVPYLSYYGHVPIVLMFHAAVVLHRRFHGPTAWHKNVTATVAAAAFLDVKDLLYTEHDSQRHFTEEKRSGRKDVLEAIGWLLEEGAKAARRLKAQKSKAQKTPTA